MSDPTVGTFPTGTWFTREYSEDGYTKTVTATSPDRAITVSVTVAASDQAYVANLSEKLRAAMLRMNILSWLDRYAPDLRLHPWQREWLLAHGEQCQMREYVEAGTFTGYVLIVDGNGNTLDILRNAGTTARPYLVRAVAWEVTNLHVGAPSDLIGFRFRKPVPFKPTERLVPLAGESSFLANLPQHTTEGNH